jgi:hypothetical protein
MLILFAGGSPPAWSGPPGSPASGEGQGPSAATQPADSRTRAYSLEFSTFLGGAGGEQPRGMAVDEQGNIYVTGGTASRDFPTTEGGYQRKYAGGDCDVFVCKFSPAGKLIWSTLIGGANYDRAYTVKVDKDGFVYVSGRGGPGFPTTPKAFQPDFQGSQAGPYAAQNGFVVKLSPDGSKIVWSSFVGTGHECRDMDLDDRGDIYLTLPYTSSSASTMPAAWFAGAYQKAPQGDQTCGVVKLSNDGSRVLWATFIGGSKGSSQDSSLCVGPDRCPVLLVGTRSTDMPTTAGAFSSDPNTSWLGKLSADGSKLIFGTYIGKGAPRTHAAATDRQGSIFIGLQPGGEWPVTKGAFQTRFGGGRTDFGIAKFSPTGALLAATYLGGSGYECNGPDTVLVEGGGNVVIVGCTDSTDYPVTAGTFQSRNAGRFDGVLSMLSGDLSTLLYSTYMGGSKGDEMLRACSVAPDGSICVAGCTGSPASAGGNDFPTKNAFQNAYGGLPGYIDLTHNWASGDCVVARFRPSGMVLPQSTSVWTSVSVPR